MSEQTEGQRIERNYWEDNIKDEAIRAGIDPSGTVGCATLHLIGEKAVRTIADDEGLKALVARVQHYIKMWDEARDCGDTELTLEDHENDLGALHTWETHE